jgi:ribosomal-protein-alanine N-acetyltransferase
MTSTTAIRLIRESDAAALAAHYARDRDAFRPWEPARSAEFFTPQGQEQRIEGLLAAHRSGALWPAVIVVADELVGQVSVNAIVGYPLHKGVLGYWVATTHQGLGHGGRAVGLILDLMGGQLGLHRAEAFTQVGNVRSNRVLERNGFTRIGLAHEHIFIDGEWRDEVLWERLLARVGETGSVGGGS